VREKLSRRLRAALTLGAIGLLATALCNLASVLLRRARHPRVARAVIDDPAHSMSVSESGAVRSTQAADVTVPTSEADRIWNATYLERLARTYWRFLTRVTLGMIRVVYVSGGRQIVVLTRPFVLISFDEPEYQLDAEHGRVRWSIKRGVLVSRLGRKQGYLQIDVRRRDAPGESGYSTVHVELEVANFYPAIASGVSQWFYRETQSRIHVLITHAFLRSLARLDFDESHVGRFADDDAASIPGDDGAPNAVAGNGAGALRTAGSAPDRGDAKSP